MKKSNLTKKDVNAIINMRNKGMHVNYIASIVCTTNGTVSRVYRAFNGNQKIYDSLGNELQCIIDNVKYQAKKKYSEKDVEEYFIAYWKANVPEGIECKLSFNEWFNEFKKK